jgi:glycerol-3-phosphate dehydrogenase
MTGTRAAHLASLTSETFDVLVIGGGITGAGVARDAALRGLRVALVEQRDFASGTSSRSSRLVHGGVRYLEHGEVGLVFESSRERRTLLRIAPHLVRPLSFTWPVYSGARVPRWKLGAGLLLYDALSLFRNVGRHHRLSWRDVLRREPALSGTHLEGGATYWDAATDDARLTLATALAAREAGAIVLNHTRVTLLTRAEGRISGAEILDLRTRAPARITARSVVNATGPWSDAVEAMAGMTGGAVRGSKGVHIAVHRSRLGNRAAVTLAAPQDGRVMFVLPAGAFAIIGTTDTFDASDPDRVRATEGDIEYLLHAANHYFSDASLTRSDVVSAWAGIRPLAAVGAQGNDPGSASREHAISESAPGLVRVTGGKLTTYRAMAAEVVDLVERVLHRKHVRPTTHRRVLPGGDLEDVMATISAATTVVGDGVVAERLVHAYGSEWRAVWEIVEKEPLLGARITPERPYLLAELRYGVEREMAVTLGDLLIRRTPIAFETMDHGRSAARRVAEWVATWLGEPRAWESRAIEEYELEVENMFGIG